MWFNDSDTLLYFIQNFIHPFDYKTIRLINKSCDQLIRSNRFVLLKTTLLLEVDDILNLAERPNISEQVIRALIHQSAWADESTESDDNDQNTDRQVNGTVSSAVQQNEAWFQDIGIINEFDLESELWGRINQYQVPHANISDKFIEDFTEKIDWEAVSKFRKLSEDFIRKHQEDVYWEDVSRNQRLSESFISEFSHMVDWSAVSRSQKLSEEFIQKYYDQLDWNAISKSQKLSEEFIALHEELLDWSAISKTQKLSEEFMRTFQHRLDWDMVAKYQNMTISFIYEFKDKINLKLLRPSNVRKEEDDYKTKMEVEEAM